MRRVGQAVCAGAVLLAAFGCLGAVFGSGEARPSSHDRVAVVAKTVALPRIASFAVAVEPAGRR